MESYNTEAEYIETNDDTQNDAFSLLPDELLVKIFRYLQDPSTELYQNIGKRKSRHHCVGYILPLVCKRWNRIANDPYLWTRITINRIRLSAKQMVSCLQSKPNIRILELDLVSPDINLLVDVFPLCQDLQCLRVDCTWCDLPQLSSKSIEHIVLQVHQISEEQMLDLCQQLPNLTSVHLSGYISVTSLSLNHIANNLKGLQVLVATLEHGGPWDESLRNLFDKQKNSLMQLCLYSCASLTDSAFVGIENCTNLVKLSLDGTEELTDRFLNMISRLPHLAFLFFDSSKCFTEKGWNQFLDHRVCSLKTCQLLDLNCGRDIVTDNGFTDDVLEMLAIKSPQLYYLSLHDIPRITDRGVQAIINNCSVMEILKLSDLPQVTAKPFFEIPQRMPKLKCLSVSGYKAGLSDDQKEENRQHLISLGVPVEGGVTFEDPWRNVLCNHFTQTTDELGQFI